MVAKIIHDAIINKKKTIMTANVHDFALIKLIVQYDWMNNDITHL